MPVITVYPDLLAGGWPLALERHARFFAGLEETYGPDLFGPLGVRGAAALAGPDLLAEVALAARRAAWEPLAQAALRRAAAAVAGALGGAEPDLYLATLLDLAPAATIAVAEQPAAVVGLERFAGPPGPPPRHYYAPEELDEIVAHETCHVARMAALGLPPTPRRLPLREMLLLEGTAVLLTDALAGRETLGHFMAAADIRRHRALEPSLWEAVRPDLDRRGMDVFRQYFGAGSTISGYYLGWRAGQGWLERTGGSLDRLIVTPAADVLQSAGPC